MSGREEAEELVFHLGLLWEAHRKLEAAKAEFHAAVEALSSAAGTGRAAEAIERLNAVVKAMGYAESDVVGVASVVAKTFRTSQLAQLHLKAVPGGK